MCAGASLYINKKDHTGERKKEFYIITHIFLGILTEVARVLLINLDKITSCAAAAE